MSAERLAVVSFLTCLCAGDLYAFALPQGGAASIPSTLLSIPNQMNAAIDAKIGKPSSRGGVDEKVVLPRLSRGCA